MADQAEHLLDKAINAIDEVLLSHFAGPGIVTTEILTALSTAGFVLVEKPAAGAFPKCPVCNGLGFAATVEQFENAYKRH